MAEYRRILSQKQRAQIQKKYKLHKSAEGGIFGESVRRRLLGVKAKSKVAATEDTSDFWHDIKTKVASALIDLSLLSEVAHPERLLEIFRPLTEKDWKKEDQAYSRSDMATIIDAILRSADPDEESQRKKYEFASSVVVPVIRYLKDRHEFQTSLHQRLFEEMIDTITFSTNYYAQTKYHQAVIRIL